MKKTKITQFQYLIMTFFLLNSFIPLIGYHTITKINNTTSLISIIIGYFFITIYIFLIKNIFHYNKNLTIIEKIERLLPKSKYPIFIIMSIILIISLLYSLNNLVTFINYYILKDISLIIITFSFLLTILYALTKSMDSIFRLAEICFYIYFLIFIISIIGISKYINLYNIKPLLASPIKNTIISSFVYMTSSIIPLFLLGIIPLNNISKNKKLDNTLMNASKLSSLIIFVNFFAIITTLGIELSNIYQNPDIILYKKISLLNILERVETTLAFNNILNSFFYILIGVYFLKEIIIHIFHIKKEKEVLSLSLIIFALMIISTILTISQNIYMLVSLLCLFIVLIINFKLFIGKYNLQKLKK